MVRATSTTTAPCLLVDRPHHAEVHDGVAQLGVDHLAQALAHLLLARAIRPARPLAGARYRRT